MAYVKRIKPLDWKDAIIKVLAEEGREMTVEDITNKIIDKGYYSTASNDTPQNTGDFADDTHTSHITQTSGTSEVEVKTPIERLKEIQDGYSDVLARWSEEFNTLFLEEGNLSYD